MTFVISEMISISYHEVMFGTHDMTRVAHRIKSIRSYRDHKADIGITIKMTDERYF